MRVVLVVAMLFAFGCTSVPSPQSLNVKRMAVNGTELSYVEDGQGETVLFIHGACGDYRTWDGLRASIAQRYHFVALSRRFHYPNAWPSDGSSYTMEQQVEDVAVFIRALNVGPVHLVGGSWGGRLVGYVALKYPNRVRSVVMSDPINLVALTSDEAKGAAAEFGRDIAPSIAAAKKGDDRQAAILLFNAVSGDAHAFNNASAARQERWLSNARTVAPMYAGANFPPAQCQALSELKMPAMVMRGENTRAIFRLTDDAVVACLPPGTEIAVVPGATHMWYPVAPVDGAQAILAFISKH